jgi:hypothetical protein
MSASLAPLPLPPLASMHSTAISGKVMASMADGVRW